MFTFFLLCCCAIGSPGCELSIDPLKISASYLNQREKRNCFRLIRQECNDYFNEMHHGTIERIKNLQAFAENVDKKPFDDATISEIESIYKCLKFNELYLLKIPGIISKVRSIASKRFKAPSPSNITIKNLELLRNILHFKESEHIMNGDLDDGAMDNRVYNLIKLSQILIQFVGVPDGQFHCLNFAYHFIYDHLSAQNESMFPDFYTMCNENKQHTKVSYLESLMDEHDLILWHPNYSHSNWTIESMDDIYGQALASDYLQSVLFGEDKIFMVELFANFVLRLVDVWNMNLSFYRFEFLFDDDFYEYDALMNTFVELVDNAIIFWAEWKLR